MESERVHEPASVSGPHQTNKSTQETGGISVNRTAANENNVSDLSGDEYNERVHYSQWRNNHWRNNGP